MERERERDGWIKREGDRQGSQHPVSHIEYVGSGLISRSPVADVQQVHMYEGDDRTEKSYRQIIYCLTVYLPLASVYLPLASVYTNTAADG